MFLSPLIHILLSDISLLGTNMSISLFYQNKKLLLWCHTKSELNLNIIYVEFLLLIWWFREDLDLDCEGTMLLVGFINEVNNLFGFGVVDLLGLEGGEGRRGRRSREELDLDIGIRLEDKELAVEVLIASWEREGFNEFG